MSGGRSHGERDPRSHARRALAADRFEDPYERARRRDVRRRRQLEDRTFDPRPPDDDDWVVADPERDGVRRVGPPVPVGEALEGLVRRRGWEERLRGATVWSRWDDVVGADLAQRCEPVRLAGGTLVVRAESQVWATQLRYLTATLRNNACRLLDGPLVREVQVVVGPLTGQGPGAPR